MPHEVTWPVPRVIGTMARRDKTFLTSSKLLFPLNASNICCSMKTNVLERFSITYSVSTHTLHDSVSLNQPFSLNTCSINIVYFEKNKIKLNMQYNVSARSSAVLRYEALARLSMSVSEAAAIMITGSTERVKPC